MTDQADPQLLSMLQKAANPLQRLNLSIKIKGVFAPPQQWKLTDQANPNIFTYMVQCFNQTFVSGKIEPRKLTEQQIKEAQEAKNKKGGKKQTKQEQKPVQIDPQQVKRRQQWQALSQQEKFYRTSQDPYKMFSLKFAQNNKDVNLERQQLTKFEQNIDSGEVQIKLIRKPEMSQQDLAKLKKSKPKNLNLGELYSALYIGKIHLKELSAPGSKSFVQRIPIEFKGQVPADGIQIKAQKCYILLEVQLDNPIFPQVTQVKPQVSSIFPQFQKSSGKKDTHSISKLKLQIIRAIKAISQQYSQTFSKDKQHQDDRKHSNLGSISTLRMNQINKKKQQFLNQFVNNGKYAILRDRISLTIKAICIDKFRKEKQKGPIDKQKINKTLSELNVYFRQKFIQIVDQFLNNQSQMVHQDLVLGHETSRHIRRQTLAPIVSQTKQEKQLRLANEYQIIGKNDKSQNNYLNILIMKEEDLPSLQSYARFCLKNKKFDSALLLYQKIVQKDRKIGDTAIIGGGAFGGTGFNKTGTGISQAQNSQRNFLNQQQQHHHQQQQLNHKLTLSILLVRRKRSQQVIKLVTQLIQSQKSSINDKIIYNQLLSFMAQRQDNIKLSQKYLALAEKYYQIKLNPNIKLNPIRNPYQELNPKIPKPARYTSQLTSQQSQQIRINFINVLAQNYAYDLVQQFLNKLNNCFRKQILNVEVKSFNQSYEDALQILTRLIDSRQYHQQKGEDKEKDQKQNDIDRDKGKEIQMELLFMKADICYKADKMFQSQQIFLNLLRQKPSQNQIFSIYLRLGYTYLNRKSWDDARVIFQKAVQIKCNSALSWLGLGIANLNLGKIKQSQEAIDLCNVYNPLDQQNENYLKRIRQIQKKDNEKEYIYLKQSPLIK